MSDPTHDARGGSLFDVLSGQRRPELSSAEGVRLAADSIAACLPHAAACGVTLILENHYKDDFWEYPEFAQKMDVFCKLVDALPDSGFGVNYDPSNAYIAGDDPLELLRRELMSPRWRPEPIAISAGPASDMILRTSAKSRFTIPGTVISSLMPWMPWRSTSSAIVKASSIEMFSSPIWSRRSPIFTPVMPTMSM
mgnify:CR=1 FL=1